MSDTHADFYDLLSGRFNQAIFTTQGYPGDRDGGNRPYRQDSNTLQDPNNGNLPQLGCDATGPIVSLVLILCGTSIDILAVQRQRCRRRPVGQPYLDRQQQHLGCSVDLYWIL